MAKNIYVTLSGDRRQCRLHTPRGVYTVHVRHGDNALPYCAYVQHPTHGHAVHLSESILCVIQNLYRKRVTECETAALFAAMPKVQKTDKQIKAENYVFTKLTKKG